MSNAALRQPLIGTAVRQRLAGFVATLRDNGFAVGLAETQDALAILSSPLARRSSALEPALRTLFCTTHSDWQRFGEVFRAFWLGQGVRHIQRIAGTPANDRAPLRRLPEIGGASPPGPPEQAEARRDGPSEAEPTGGQGRRGGASRGETLATTDLRHVTDPDDVAAVHALAERLAHSMRVRLVRRERVRRRGRRIDLRRGHWLSAPFLMLLLCLAGMAVGLLLDRSATPPWVLATLCTTGGGSFAASVARHWLALPATNLAMVLGGISTIGVVEMRARQAPRRRCRKAICARAGFNLSCNAAMLAGMLLGGWLGPVFAIRWGLDWDASAMMAMMAAGMVWGMAGAMALYRTGFTLWDRVEPLTGLPSRRPPVR